jgi:hypothetical protein
MMKGLTLNKKKVERSHFITKPIINPRAPLLSNLSLTITRPHGRKTAEFTLPPVHEFSAAKETCNAHLGLSSVRQEYKDSHWV